MIQPVGFAKTPRAAPVRRIIAAVTLEDLLRSALRGEWRLSPAGLAALDGGTVSGAYSVVTATENFVIQLVSTADRAAFEAGLGAIEHVRTRAVDAGVPVRTRGGALTATTPAGVLAVLRQLPGRPLAADNPLDQHWWGDALGRAHAALDGFKHPGLRRWHWLRADAAHLAVEPWIRPAVTEAIALMTRLTVTDRLTYGVLHGDPAPGGFQMDIATGRTGLARWGPAGTGPLVYDLAAAVAYAGGIEVAGDLIDGYTAAGPVSAGEVEAALPVLIRFRLASQIDWYARRIAADDLIGGGPTTDNVAGLHRARAALVACAPGSAA